MGFKVAFTKEALKSLKKLDKGIARLITSWIRKNLEGCTDPRAHGKGLVANRSGQWRYRIGDYRLLCEIQDEQILILILEIGHRREIYIRNKKTQYFQWLNSKGVGMLKK